MDAKEQKWVIFRLGNEEYGVEIMQVDKIERMKPITRVPKTPAFVEGVINLRGEIVPVIDLRKRFDMPTKEVTDDTRVVVALVGELSVGLIVDEVTRVMSLPQDAIEPPPSLIGSVDVTYVRGVGKLDDQLLVLLDLAKVLDIQEVTQIKAM